MTTPIDFELKPIDFNKPKKDKAKILIAQSAWEHGQLDIDSSNDLYRLKFNTDNEQFLHSILDKGKEEHVDLIVFPEFAIPQQYHEEIRQWSSNTNNTIVVAGSDYLEREGKFYNTASIFFQGKHYKTEKHKLSPHEVSSIEGLGASDGTEHYFFQNTPVGNLAVMVCIDAFHENIRHEFSNESWDIFCVIAVQSEAKQHHQVIDRIVKDNQKGIYVIYCNALCFNADGRSAFFGHNYKDNFARLKKQGLTPDDGIDNRAIEMPAKQGCLIVECNLQNKTPSLTNIDPDRSLIKVWLPFVFQNGALEELTLDELKEITNTKSPQTKTEYKPAIPPVRTFIENYIGRQADIDYLNEFLNNQKKYFLLLYGVGGMGKSHLLYHCMTAYRGKTFFYHVISPNEDFSLNKLFAICLIPKPDDNLSLSDKHDLFIQQFQKNNTFLILDDYYEVQQEEIKSLLPKLIGIGGGKLLLLSRVIPANILRHSSEFLHHKITALPEAEFKQLMQSYIQTKNIALTIDEIHLIFTKAQGYPLGGQLIIDANTYCTSLSELLDDLPKFEAELDHDGKNYSGRLLDGIFQKGNQEEIKLLCEFSALFGSSDIEIIRQLPSYKLSVFSSLHERKSFIDKDNQGKFSSHAMIKDFAYERLENKRTLHLKLGRYFSAKIKGTTDADWQYLNDAILHYAKVGGQEFNTFKQRVEINFESRNIKGLIAYNSINTIRNYTVLINLYPDKPAYYNELGIAYRLNKQFNNAIETFKQALVIDPDNVKVLNELGITYRENNQKTLAIETFKRALEIDRDNVKVLNELGITYRENNQKTKAIATFKQALEIDRDNVKVLNELGITYRENNQNTLAIETFKRALEIDRDNVKVLNELGITYRENNQKTKAIATFEWALVIDHNALPALNELGITYRENNQKTLAIATFSRALYIDPKHLPSLNELGITYRENNQVDEAIETCLKAIKMHNRYAYLNLLQIYLFFKPDTEKATENFIVLLETPRLKAFNSSRKKYKQIINNLQSLWNTSINDFALYESFMFSAIQHKAYLQVLPILEKLDKKFPDNVKLKSRLGKTLSNQVINEYEKGQSYLKQAIALFKKENNHQQLQQHILYYCYSLNNHEQFDLLVQELKNYESDLIQDAEYFRFMGHYAFAKHQDLPKAINYFEQAIKMAEESKEQREYAETLLRLLSEQNSPLYKDYFVKYQAVL